MSFPSYALRAAGYSFARASLTLGVNDAPLVQGLNRAQGSVHRFMTATSGLARAATFAISGPLVAAGALAVAVSAQYDAAMRHVQAVSNATAKEYQLLKRQTQDLAEVTKFTMREVAQAQVFLAMAGLDVTTILGSMPAILNLATASGLELARVSDLLTNIMTAFQIEASGANKVMDTLTATFTNSNTNMEQLAEALKYVAPAVSALGHTVGETAAAIGVLGNQGIQASLAGTYMRAVFRELARPTGQLKKSIAELGLTTRNFAGELLNAAELAEEFERVGGGPADAARAFGRKGGTGAAALVAAGPEEIRRMMSLQKFALQETQNIAETMLDHLIGDLQILYAKAQTFLNRIAESGLGQGVRAIVKGLQQVFDWLNKVSDESIRMATNIGAFFAVLFPSILVLASTGTRILNTLAAFRAVKALAPAGALATGGAAAGVGAGLSSAAVALTAAAGRLTAAAVALTAAGRVATATRGSGLISGMAYGGAGKATGGLAIGGFRGGLRDIQTGRMSSGAAVVGSSMYVAPSPVTPWAAAQQRATAAASTMGQATRTTTALNTMRTMGTRATAALAGGFRVAAAGAASLAGFLIGPQGIIIAITALLTLGPFLLFRKMERGMRQAQIAAADYVSVLKEIRRIEQEQIEGEASWTDRAMAFFDPRRTIGFETDAETERQRRLASELSPWQERLPGARAEGADRELKEIMRLRIAVGTTMRDFASGERDFNQIAADLENARTAMRQFQQESEFTPELTEHFRLLRMEIEAVEQRLPGLRPIVAGLENAGRQLNFLEDQITAKDILRFEAVDQISALSAQLEIFAQRAREAGESDALIGMIETMTRRLEEAREAAQSLEDPLMTVTTGWPWADQFGTNLRNVAPGGPFGGGIQDPYTATAPSARGAFHGLQAIEPGSPLMLDQLAAKAIEENRQKMQAMFSDFGRDLGSRFARAIVEGTDTLGEDFRKALMAEGMQRIFTEAGDFLGTKLSEQVAKQMSAEQAGGVALIASLALWAKNIGDSQYQEGMAAQAEQRADYGSLLTQMSEIYEQLTEDHKAQMDALRDSFPHLSGWARLLAIVNAQIELGSTLLDEQTAAMAEQERAIQDLQNDWENLVLEAMELGYVTDDLRNMTFENLDISKYAAEWEKLTGLIEELGQKKESLAFLQDLQGSISSHLPLTPFQQLGQTGKVDPSIADEFKKAGGNVETLYRFGSALQRLQQFEGLVDQFRETGEVLGRLDQIVQRITGVSLAALQTRLEAIEKLMDFGNEFQSALSSFLPETPMETFFSSGALSPEIRKRLEEMGVAVELAEKFAEAQRALHEYDAGGAGASRQTPAELAVTRFRDYLLPAFRDLQESILAESQVNRDALDFLRQNNVNLSAVADANDHLEFALEEVEYGLRKNTQNGIDELDRNRDTLQSAVETAAFALNEAIALSMSTLAQNQADSQKIMEDALAKAHARLVRGVENAADDLNKELQQLMEDLSTDIEDLEAAIRDLIAALRGLVIPGSGGYGSGDPTKEWVSVPTPPGPSKEESIQPGQTLLEWQIARCQAMGGTPIVIRGRFEGCKLPRPVPTPIPPTPVPPNEPTVPVPPDDGGDDGDPVALAGRSGSGGNQPAELHLHLSGGGDPIDRLRNAIETNEGRIRDLIRDGY